MRQIIYCSRATEELCIEELLVLLYYARLHNEEVGITGMLLHSGGRFIQLLEGDDDEVGTTFASIAGDERHRDVRIVLDATVDERMFPDWRMGFEHVDDEVLASVIEGFAPTSSIGLFDPSGVDDAATALDLLAGYVPIGS